MPSQSENISIRGQKGDQGQDLGETKAYKLKDEVKQKLRGLLTWKELVT